DVVLWFAEPDTAKPADWPAETFVIQFCGDKTDAAALRIANHATETGLVPSFANVMPGWVFTSELVGALTRAGKMPVMYETIGLYDGFGRSNRSATGERPFHTAMTIEAVADGDLGMQFVNNVSAMLTRVKKEESADIAKAAAWVHDAKAA